MDVTPANPPSVPPRSPEARQVFDIPTLARAPITLGVVILMLVTVLGAGGGLWLRIDSRIDLLDHKLDSRIDRLDQKFELKFDRLQADLSKTREEVIKLDGRIDTLEAKLDARFDKVDARFDKLEALLTQGKGR